ncbi:MAG TPA: excinuclease ABC subunit UvrA [Oligoflexia bacterium]|nr:excinuclease ABC subunit UvrA [Oligoflexia bacterium]HMP26910.1 excinuclease ABC subunit UvrA [Oligoflexia bacterium]
MKSRYLEIKGAREHNLKDLSIDIPHDQMTVVTGVSGSGKSSLAFDTVYAEGQRRYVETFSPYTRQFFEKVKRPNVDSIKNVRPAIAIRQKTKITSSRSSVGTLSNIDDYLKIIWSNLAAPFCSNCGNQLSYWTSDKIAREIFELFERSPSAIFYICSNFNLKKKNPVEEVERLILFGYERVLNQKNCNLLNLSELSPAFLKEQDYLLILLDRLTKKTLKIERVAESVEAAFSISGGKASLVAQTEGATGPKIDVINYNKIPSCGCSDITIDAPKPSLFSFNHPYGACQECKGFGFNLEIDPSKVAPNQDLSIEENAIHPWAGASMKIFRRRLLNFCETKGINLKTPWKKLKQEQKDLILNHKSREYVGLNHWFKKLEKKSYKTHVRIFLSKYRSQVLCKSCEGSRLKRSALAYRLGGLSIADLWRLQIKELKPWFDSQYQKALLLSTFPKELTGVFQNLLSRLDYLLKLGLGYLTLDRQARTLSGGETQRLNLAAAISGGIVSSQFVLDEPSVGLHSRDTKNLISAINDLRDQGNSVLIVEHDLEYLKNADNVLEIGPGAGNNGGSLVYFGESNKFQLPFFETEKGVENSEKAKIAISIKSARARNLKGFDLDIPAAKLIAISGVSGSGKSTLVKEVIFQSSPGSCEQIFGKDSFDEILFVDQTSLAKSPRSNIATYSGIWEVLRNQLANSPDAKLRKLTKSHFSFNVDRGRCATCKGAGYLVEEMQFLADVYLTCEVCLGKRFSGKVLECFIRNKNAADLLATTVSDCGDLFSDLPELTKITSVLEKLGLGHLTLGHPLSELSGGESQRLKLAPFIVEAEKEKALLIFDEPTTGLHRKDVARLVRLFRELTDRGQSIICVEHNLDLIASADWIIDLGPEGGSEGGELIKVGTPNDFISGELNPRSYTQIALKERSKLDDQTNKIIQKNFKKDGSFAEISIFGAKEHNLKNIDIKIPLYKLVALTGVSGSGKSTIAKDIIYAEGQRRYLETLSPYARQFVSELKKPDILDISGVPPTVCVYQHTFQPSKLSTVGTMSEAYNYLRLLYAKCGLQHCPDHPASKISDLSAEEIAAEIKTSYNKSIRIMAPIVSGKKGKHNEIIKRAIDEGYDEIQIDRILFCSPNSALDSLDRNKQHWIKYVIGKLNPANIPSDLLIECVNKALALGEGALEIFSDNNSYLYSAKRSCSECGRGFSKPDPEDLSFISRRGACPSCSGSGFEETGAFCKFCGGARLKREALCLTINGLNIAEAASKTPPEMLGFLKSINLKSFPKLEKLAPVIISECERRLETLIKLGLSYLPLDRSARQLSSGELQRLRIASAIGSPLTGTFYIFDEPSAGLHPLENRLTLAALRELVEQGNSVLMIEHDLESIRAADYVIDVGPGGGKNGGKIIYNGDSKNFKVAEALSFNNIEVEASEKKFLTKWLTVKNARLNNLKSLDLKIPLQYVVVVAGVSGAGKSSLVNGTIAETICSKYGKEKKWLSPYGEITSDLEIIGVKTVDQSPIGGTSRSTPASYLGIWDHIRKIFANTLEAKARGFSPSYFSFNAGEGRCQICKGLGEIKLEMSFLADAVMICETCGGSRYGELAKIPKFEGLSVDQILGLTFEEAKNLFVSYKNIHRVVLAVCELGLGYLTLGQPSNSLSGGESQRIKLAEQLAIENASNTLFILDEPTTGLHNSDVAKLMAFLKKLASSGNTIIMIEHNEIALANADWIIELGPKSGEEGGKIVFQGESRKLLEAKTAWGGFLKESLLRLGSEKAL